MADNKAQLDHVILLLPYPDLANPPAWLTDNLVVSPGGKHGDGKTENRLVLFADGTYLELIAFIDDDAEKRRGHWWDKPFGVVDFALTTTKALDYSALKERLAKTETGVMYAEPQEGGRVTPDGVELQWKVTFPTGIGRGNVPFWCHDITPRGRRVPITEDNTKHPCGASGMAGVQLEINDSKLEIVQKATAAIVQSEGRADGPYELGTPHEGKGAQQPSIRLVASGEVEAEGVKLSLVLRTPNTTPPDNIEQKFGGGVVSIRFEQ